MYILAEATRASITCICGYTYVNTSIAPEEPNELIDQQVCDSRDNEVMPEIYFEEKKIY